MLKHKSLFIPADLQFPIGPSMLPLKHIIEFTLTSTPCFVGVLQKGSPDKKTQFMWNSRNRVVYKDYTEIGEISQINF